jgi:hypothetical protein
MLFYSPLAISFLLYLLSSNDMRIDLPLLHIQIEIDHTQNMTAR